MTQRVYISGPTTGMPNLNREAESSAFPAAQLDLELQKRINDSLHANSDLILSLIESKSIENLSKPALLKSASGHSTLTELRRSMEAVNNSMEKLEELLRPHYADIESEFQIQIGTHRSIIDKYRLNWPIA